MKLKLVEPLRELFKDEVRALGVELGLPPASSAAIRSPARAWPSASPARSRAEKLEILRKADAIYLDEIRKAGLYDAIWQAFAVLLPVHTVGVMGDARTYEDVCALRAVTSTDGMTADFFQFAMSSSAARRPASSTRCAGSTAWSTTSPASRRGRSSGNDFGPFGGIRQAINEKSH